MRLGADVIVFSRHQDKRFDYNSVLSFFFYRLTNRFLFADLKAIGKRHTCFSSSMSMIIVLEIWTMTVLSLFPWGGVWENSERIRIGGLNIKKLTVEAFKTYYWRYSNFSRYNSFYCCLYSHYLFSQKEDSERTLLSFARGLRWRHFRKILGELLAYRLMQVCIV